MADVTPPHHFGTSVSMVMVENLKVNNIANLHVTRNITVKFLEVWNKFNNFCTLVTMATSTILNFINMPKASTYYGEYSYDVS
jgi:hypothetical protein